MDHQNLVKEVLRLNPEAQRQLYEKFAPQMLGVCYRYTKSIADAEDILQDGFLKVYNNLHQYNFKGELGAWIRKIMVNTTLNYLKKNKKYRSDMVFENLTLHPVSGDDPELKLESKELAELIRQLPTGFQAIFNLHAVEGYKHEEIAGMLGITDGTSRSQYARARALLIEWINNRSMENKQNYATR